MTDKTEPQKAVAHGWIERFERIMVFVGIVGPFATLPQLYKLYFSHSEHAVGQSLTTWALYAILSGLWTVYGVVEGKAPIYLGNGISCVLNSLMAVGIVMHAGWTF